MYTDACQKLRVRRGSTFTLLGVCNWCFTFFFFRFTIELVSLMLKNSFVVLVALRTVVFTLRDAFIAYARFRATFRGAALDRTPKSPYPHSCPCPPNGSRRDCGICPTSDGNKTSLSSQSVSPSSLRRAIFTRASTPSCFCYLPIQEIHGGGVHFWYTYNLRGRLRRSYFTRKPWFNALA